jgi:acetolactate synthase-1/2/3 large subunit
MAANRREIADELVGAAAARGTRFAFGVPGGGSNLDVAGACERHGVQFVLTHLETSAALMAGVIGELTGAPGIAVGTRGPGATAAANGVANALLERSPMIMVNDCVLESESPRISHQRINQTALFEPIALASGRLNGQDPHACTKLVQATTVQPPGPVQVDIDPTASGSYRVERATDDQADPNAIAPLLASARRPVIIAGQGILTIPVESRERVITGLRGLAARTHTPVLTTYKARGVVADASEFAAGIVTGGTVESHALNDADLILGIGLDPVELLPTAWNYAAPTVIANPWLIDDATYFGDSLAGCYAMDMELLIHWLGNQLASDWELEDGCRYRDILRTAALTQSDQKVNALSPAEIVSIASRICPRPATATVDAGAHMLVAMPLWEASEPQRLLISSSHATMGYSLPAAIAASLVRPDEPVICFTGDGGLGMVLAELETLARLQLPVVVVVFNDSLLSLIAVKQSPVDQGGKEVVAYQSTDFAAVARACGVEAWAVRDAGEYEAALQSALSSGRPALIDVATDPSSYGPVFSALRE